MRNSLVVCSKCRLCDKQLSCECQRNALLKALSKVPYIHVEGLKNYSVAELAKLIEVLFYASLAEFNSKDLQLADEVAHHWSHMKAGV